MECHVRVLLNVASGQLVNCVPTPTLAAVGAIFSGLPGQEEGAEKEEQKNVAELQLMVTGKNSFTTT